MTKKCFKCGQDKPVEDFYRHPEMADGRLGKCKDCTKRDVRKNYADNRPKKAEYDRLREQTAHRKALRAKYQKQRRLKNPEKYKARMAVSNALRDKKLTRGPCIVCGSDKTHAHHEDYSRPLEVTWVCFAHHMEAHGKMTRSAA